MILYTDKHHIPFQIDEADYEAVSRYCWHINSDGYPCTAVGKVPHQRGLKLHTFLMGPPPPGKEWDHEDRDKKNNQRHNLRPLTHGGNIRNRDARRDNRAGVRGVYWHQGKRRWVAHIGISDPSPRLKHLGYFDTIEEAAAARREAERIYWAAAPATEVSPCA